MNFQKCILQKNCMGHVEKLPANAAVGSYLAPGRGSRDNSSLRHRWWLKSRTLGSSQVQSLQCHATSSWTVRLHHSLTSSPRATAVPKELESSGERNQEKDSMLLLDWYRHKLETESKPQTNHSNLIETSASVSKPQAQRQLKHPSHSPWTQEHQSSLPLISLTSPSL